jgi:hypothetical protein
MADEDPVSHEVVAVLDWEFSHRCRVVEDLVWAEWIVRRHHLSAIPELAQLFERLAITTAWRE